MQEVFRNFGQIGKAFREDTESTVTVRDVERVLENDERFKSLDYIEQKMALNALHSISDIDWKAAPKALDESSIKTLRDLQEDLEMEEDFSEYFMKGTFWTSSEKLKVHDVLNIYHNERFPEDSVSEPYSAVGAAAHWVARISGASWTEAVYCSRWAQGYFDSVIDGPYDHLFEIMEQRHGMKEELIYGKN